MLETVVKEQYSTVGRAISQASSEHSNHPEILDGRTTWRRPLMNTPVRGIIVTLTVALSIAIGVVSSQASGGEPDPLVEVRTTVGQAVAILHNSQLPVEQRRRQLRALAEHRLDLPKMARGSLGQHWNDLTQTECDQFVPLFTAFIEDAYLSQIQNYETLKIDASKETRLDADHVNIAARVIQPGEDILPITFMLERTGDGWMIYDVAVEDVSMVENYRAQFDRVIRNQGMPQLLASLRRKQSQLGALVGSR
jgi:phospholipid transport system substrate-binding protein